MKKQKEHMKRPKRSMRVIKKNMPRLKRLTWAVSFDAQPLASVDRTTYDAINALLASRGGRIDKRRHTFSAEDGCLRSANEMFV